MSNIHLNGSSGNPHLNLGNSNGNGGNVSLADSTMPKYIGARAVVTRAENGVVIWLKDYQGETQETIAEAIDSITTNEDGSLTFTLPDSRTITTGSLTGPQGEQGEQGEPGDTGNGIASIEKTGTSGLVDTYTITYTDGDSDTFTVTNGQDGEDGEQGETGNGIASIEQTGTSGLVDTYTITYTDGDSDTFTVTNGADGQDGTSAGFGTCSATVDANTGTPSVTVTSSGPDTAKEFAFAFSNLKGTQGSTGATGNGIASITKTGTSGLVDTYTITFTNGTTTTFTVTNGANGSGSVADVWVDGTSVLDGDTAKIDLTGKANVSDLATVATSGDYDDLLDKPTIPSLGKTIPYGECSTATSTVAKTVTIAGVTELTQGLTIAVKFSEANSATNPTLQVNSLTAKPIKKYGTTAPGTSSAMSWYGGSVLIMVYDGTYWQICNWDNKDTTYSSLTQSDMQTGTATTGRLITAYRLKEAILYHETGEPNVQSDWNQTDTDADDYIKNKPSIPTVNDATLTIQKNSTNVATFTANDSSNVTADISVPTDTGDLTNGAGFLDASGILNLFYPVGSYYETSDTAFDPNVSWGGTWSLEKEGQVHISAGTNYAVAGALTNTTDGGENTHKLTVNEMPSHEHEIKWERSYNVSLNGGSGTYGYHLSWTPQEGSGRFYGVSVGGSQAHNNMQPYIIVNRWHRTA